MDAHQNKDELNQEGKKKEIKEKVEPVKWRQNTDSFIKTILFLILYISIGILILRPIVSLGDNAFIFIVLVASILSMRMSILKSAGKQGPRKPARIAVILFFAFAVLWILNSCMRMDFFNADNYKKTLGNVNTNSSFETDIHEVKKENMIIFDEIVARNIGEKVLGSQTTLGSQVELGNFALQNVNGKFYWIAPLLHSGFFKYWVNASDGSPGYVKVSANDDQDVELFTSVGGKPLKIVYQSGAYLAKNLANHLFLNGFISFKINEPEFEIDDQGNPFWIVPISKRNFGSKKLNVDKLLVVNPETGDIQSYDPKDAPKWVDRIFTPEILEDQVLWWGEYVHGYWNLAHEDIMVPSGEMVMVYGKEGHCMWYQGMTSKGLDNATVGFLLIDSKTKQVNFYKRVGATETSAMQSAEGKVQEKGYFAGHPTAYNISGEPTYCVPLHDKSNLVKAIALVNIHDYNHLVVGSTLDEVLRDYEIMISGKASKDSSKKNKNFSVNARVLRTSSFQRGGSSMFGILLIGNENTSLYGDPLQLNDLMFTVPGDSVKVVFTPVSGQKFGNIVSIQNLTIK